MFKWESILQTRNITRGVNKCDYIIVHHCGGTSLRGNLDILLGNTSKQVSAHVLIDGDGKAYKLADPRHITWHAGISRWGNDMDAGRSLNSYAIGIELLGPYPGIGFTDAQKKTLNDIVRHLMFMYDIPKENVLRHADVTGPGAAKKIHWDNKALNRKIDIDIRITGGLTWKEFTNKLTPKEYKDIYVNQEIREKLIGRGYTNEDILEMIRKKYGDNSFEFKSFQYYIK